MNDYQREVKRLKRAHKYDVVISKIIYYSLITILVIGAVYLFRVLPYDNDWSCVIAECRKVK